MTIVAALGAALLAIGLRGRIILAFNLDPVGYSVTSSGEPGTPPGETEIPAARMVGPELSPGVAIEAWKAGFVCTPRGWRQVGGAVILSRGVAIGSSKPPPDWVPPRPC